MMKNRPIWQERLEKLVSSMGYELIGIATISHGRYITFRIYIERTDGSHITIDDCSRASHQISAMLDVEESVLGPYTLEVSSPGIDVPLFDIGHYRKHLGKHVRIRLHVPMQHRKQLKGVLVRVEDENIYLLLDGSNQEVVLPFSAIEKANLIGEVHF